MKERYGRWLVHGEYILTKKGEKKYLCRCDCGTERYVLERSLKSGGSLSCGCLRKENVQKVNRVDLHGKEFGELTVLGKADIQRKNGGIWWHCRCACGGFYDVPGTLLLTGKRTHCSNRIHTKNYAYKDITGKRFHLLTAIRPTSRRDKKGNVIWTCRCECGNEVDVSYNVLVHCNVKSCGCMKAEHEKNLKDYLTYVAGTSVDILKSKKVPKNNTTGYRGVYLIKGKYTAKIVFQQKAYYLGNFINLEEAVLARKEAEELLFDGSKAFYERWKARADADPGWALKNPVKIIVTQDETKTLSITFLPQLEME